MATATDRKKAERERNKAAGLVRVEVWAHPDDKERIRQIAERFAQRRKKKKVIEPEQHYITATCRTTGFRTLFLGDLIDPDYGNIGAIDRPQVIPYGGIKSCELTDDNTVARYIGIHWKTHDLG